MGGRGDWYEWTTRLGAKQLSATLLKIMIYCAFGKQFRKGVSRGAKYRMISCLSIYSQGVIWTLLLWYDIWTYPICLTNCQDGCLRVSYTVFYEHVNFPLNRKALTPMRERIRSLKPTFAPPAYNYSDIVVWI